MEDQDVSLYNIRISDECLNVMFCLMDSHECLLRAHFPNVRISCFDLIIAASRCSFGGTDSLDLLTSVFDSRLDVCILNICVRSMFGC